MNEDPLSYTVWQPCLNLATSEEKQKLPASVPEKPRGKNLTWVLQAPPISWTNYSQGFSLDIYMQPRVHCSIIYTTQDMEAT